MDIGISLRFIYVMTAILAILVALSYIAKQSNNWTNLYLKKKKISNNINRRYTSIKLKCRSVAQHNSRIAFSVLGT